MIQNSKRIKRFFRFLLRLINPFRWEDKKPCCSKVNRVPKATTKLVPKPTKLVVKPKKPKKKSSIKKKKKKVIIRKKKRGRKNAF